MKGSLRLWADLFGTFFFVGLFTWGGGYAMIPLLSRELVERKRWLSAEEFREALALGSSVPGPLAANLAFLCGTKIGGIVGGLVAEFGCVLPSFLVFLGIAAGLVRFFSHPLAQKFFLGAGAAVTGLVAAAALRLAKEVVHNALDLFLVLACTGLILVLRVHPLFALIWALVLGAVLRRWYRAR